MGWPLGTSTPSYAHLVEALCRDSLPENRAVESVRRLQRRYQGTTHSDVPEQVDVFYRALTTLNNRLPAGQRLPDAALVGIFVDHLLPRYKRAVVQMGTPATGAEALEFARRAERAFGEMPVGADDLNRLRLVSGQAS